MNTKELYDAALIALNALPIEPIFEEYEIDDLIEFVQEFEGCNFEKEDILKISFTFEGQERTFYLTDIRGHRYYDRYYLYYQFDESDEYAIVSSGYYSSWEGSSDLEPFEVKAKKIVTDFCF